MDDYLKFLEEVGLTEEDMEKTMATLPPPVPAAERERYYVAESEINGMGVFAKEDVEGLIGIMLDGQEWHEAGRYANHSTTPNAFPVKAGTALLMVGRASKDEELTVNYRDVRRVLQ